MGFSKPKNPDDIFVVVLFEITDPDQHGPEICGALQDATGGSWEAHTLTLDKTGKITGCVFEVPKTATNLEWYPRGGYPSIALGF
jgi:hypothetical protein